MITLTRLRQNTPFILNPDLIERVDTHVDTVVRLTSGTEYVVNESGDEIVRRTIEFRARVLAVAGTMHAISPSADDEPVPAKPAAPEVAPETVWAPADEPGGDDGGDAEAEADADAEARTDAAATEVTS